MSLLDGAFQRIMLLKAEIHLQPNGKLCCLVNARLGQRRVSRILQVHKWFLTRKTRLKWHTMRIAVMRYQNTCEKVSYCSPLQSGTKPCQPYPAFPHACNTKPLHEDLVRLLFLLLGSCAQSFDGMQSCSLLHMAVGQCCITSSRTLSEQFSLDRTAAALCLC